MRAAYLDGHGTVDCVKLGELGRAPRKDDQVLVRIKAAALNQVDLYMRDSAVGITHELPLILGVDGAGVIEEESRHRADLKTGDAVLIYPGVFCSRCEFCLQGEQSMCTQLRMIGEHVNGTFAEYLSVPASNVYRVPSGLDLISAAALPAAYLTAWRMVFTRAALRPDQTAVVFGVGGGVAVAVLQLAKLAGARVIVTSSSDDKLARAAELGADEGINYRTEDVVSRIMAITGKRGADAVFDNVGLASWNIGLKVVVRNGCIITCGATTGPNPPADLQRVFIKQIRILGSTLANLDELRQLLNLVERGKLQPVVDRIFEFEELHQALAYLQEGKQFGKVGLKLAN
jgi:NADPH:quinone reductase-like Zn-dependent oxidoreductase